MDVFSEVGVFLVPFLIFPFVIEFKNFYMRGTMAFITKRKEKRPVIAWSLRLLVSNESLVE